MGRSGNRPVVVPGRLCLAGCFAGCVAVLTAVLFQAGPAAGGVPTTVASTSVAAPPGAQPARPRVRYQPPVAAPVIDPFRPPATPFGPGNRGLEYATVPGTIVAAAADGLVTFAGPVAGALHVTVGHADGIRTSYSFLAAIRVRVGQAVRRGQPIGVAARRLHVGARRGDVYLDPASLWGGPSTPVDVYLVPLDGYGAAPTGWIDVGGADGPALRRVVAAAGDQPLGSRLARGVRLVAAELDRMAASAERR